MNYEFQIYALVLSVSCPKCKAAVGKDCDGLVHAGENLGWHAVRRARADPVFAKELENRGYPPSLWLLN